MMGNPIAIAACSASVAFLIVASSNACSGNVPVTLSYDAMTCCPFQPMHGTPALCAIMVLPILSPRARMGGPLGPMNLMGGCDLANVSGRVGFSLACPHPAHTAWTPCNRANSTINVTLA